ncbi:MAG: hypothetical protein IJ542_02470 [Clostridia bacterium]|nr:hypothetical protein [Clostridia bacterium]
MVLSKMTEKGIKRYYDEEFTMTLKEYTNYRQISANKARDKIKEDLKVLFDMCIRINTKNSQTDFRIISVKSVIKNNTIKIWFTKKFLDYYSSIQYFMNLPKELFRIDVRYHPNTFGMLWKLLYHYNINENKGNKSSDCLSVIKLLEYCPTIPHYDDKLKAQGGLNQRIIQPFIRDLNAIDIIDWYFLDEQNNIVAKDCIKTYADFELLKIKFKWTNGYMVEKSKNKDLSLM